MVKDVIDWGNREGSSLPKYVAELQNLGAKYGVDVEIDRAQKTITLDPKQAMDSEGRNGFIAVDEDIRANNLDWLIQYK